ncbi:uncharacterized protein LOC113288723 [Papaver somniferum]|uniref:uncharacterized protein LOC113288723 n=1 Tax=Papaver somniferum TaxID=3469 RepID=UPI000E6F7BE2|nr:uncharacterized protein LOC113288723 [Papaver somniferum]
MIIGKTYENQAVNSSGVRIDFLLQLKMGKGNVFDRGKVIELLKRYSKFSVELKLLDAYYRRLVLELLYKHGYPFQLLFMNTSGSIFFETADNSYESKLFARWIYDRGKCAISSWISYAKLIFRLLPNLGYESKFWVIHLLVPVCVVHPTDIQLDSKLFVQMPEKDKILFARVVTIHMAIQLLVQMLEMWRPVFFRLQLECGLGHVIAVHSLGLLVVTQIHLGSFIYEFIIFNTVIILHYGFSYLPPWAFFHVAPWFSKFQGNWFDQIDRTCTLVRQVSSQLIQFDSSTSDFSYENLIFLLIFGYHSYFLAVQYIVFLCVTDVDIVEERKLTITIAARTGIHLVENVVEILNCGDAQTFILVEWLEVSASEHEHNQWLPKTMYVYRSICFMSSGYLLSGFSYFWGSASRAKVEIYVVFNCFLDCQTTCARYYTHSKCVVGSLVVMEM